MFNNAIRKYVTPTLFPGSKAKIDTGNTLSSISPLRVSKEGGSAINEEEQVRGKKPPMNIKAPDKSPLFMCAEAYVRFSWRE